MLENGLHYLTHSAGKKRFSYFIGSAISGMHDSTYFRLALYFYRGNYFISDEVRVWHSTCLLPSLYNAYDTYIVNSQQDCKIKF